MVVANIKLKHLEIILSQLMPHPKPKLGLEEYTIDPRSAIRLLYIAEYLHRDISDKHVIDLGCGTGRLTIGASLLGAKRVVGIDIDKDNIIVAEENTMMASAEVEYIVGDIEAIHGSFDTTVMNPPFGSWKKGADVSFLKKAIETSTTIYSLHKGGKVNRQFLTQKIATFSGKVDSIHEIEIKIPHTFNFHREKIYPVNVDLYRITVNR